MQPQRAAGRQFIREAWRRTAWSDATVVCVHVALFVLVASVPFYVFTEAVVALVTGHVPHAHELVALGRWQHLLVNTLRVGGLAVATALTLGTALGLLAFRTDLPLRRVLIAASVVAFCIPPYVTLVFLFARVPIFEWRGSLLACGLLNGLLFTPLATLLLGGIFAAAERAVEEQALLDARRAQVLWRITLPQARPGVFAVGLLVLLLTATEFMLANTLQIRTFAEEVFTQYAQARRIGAVLTALPMVLILAVLLLVARPLLRELGTHALAGFAESPDRLRLGPWRWPLALACLALLLTPVAVLGPALLKYFDDPNAVRHAAAALLPPLLRSVGVAAAAGVFVAVAAVGYAATIRWRRWAGAILVGLVVVLLATPTPVLGIGLIHLFNHPDWRGDLHDSPVILVLAAVIRLLPVGIVLLLPAIRRIPQELIWAARVDGCMRTGLYAHILLPLLRRDLLLVGVVVFVLAFAGDAATVLLAPPAWETVYVYAANNIHYGVYRDLAVLAILAGLCALLPAALLLSYLGSVERVAGRPSQGQRY
ncbi:MAG: ABC transporter permease subunit [Phycisphaerales bacterium]|nr:ABC transporter permease subunit [Phycisphaerales bacterium]